MGAGFEVVYVSGGRLLDAAESGRVDRETVRWALEVMGSAGVPDGMPVITVGTAIADVFWRWFRSMPVRMAPATRRKYAGHVRMFANFLAARGVAFGDLCEADIRAYALKRQSETAASSWKVEEAALMTLVRFCSEKDRDGVRVFEVNPWPLWRTPSRVRSAVARSADTVPLLPRFLDDDELQWFLRVGIQGLDPYEERQLPPDWPVAAPLWPVRDAALAGLLATAGPRVGEARLVLIDEIPTETTSRPWPSLWMRLGGARAKSRGGEVPCVPETVTMIGSWYRSGQRHALVSSAQARLGSLLGNGRLFVVEEVARAGTYGELAWSGSWLGRDRRFTATTLPRDAAAAAVRIGSGGRIEPLTIWQGPRSGGGPMSADAIEDVFAEASARAAAHPDCPFSAHLAVREVPDRRTGRPRRSGGVTPHMLRHTAAVRWFVELEQERLRRDAGRSIAAPGLPPGSFNPLLLVQAWLRHKRYSSTLCYQTCYLSRRWVERSLGDGLRLALVSGAIHR